MLKADFHIHTKEDEKENYIKYSAKELIDRAAKMGFEVLSITHHEKVFYSKKLSNYAKKRNIVLIPGIEATIEKKHVVILNPTKEVEKIKTFKQLKRYKEKNNIFIIAAHPYYPDFQSLRKKLDKEISLFDGIEYSFMYLRFFNPFNKKAVKKAKKYNKAVIGTSDSHHPFQLSKTYTLIDSEKNIQSIIKSMKQNKVKIKTKPLSIFNVIRFTAYSIFNKITK